MRIEMLSGLIKNQQVAWVAVAPVGVFPEKGFAADNRAVACIVNGGRGEVGIGKPDRRLKQLLERTVAETIHVKPMVP